MRSGASIDVCLAPYPIATHHTGVFSDKGWDITQPSSGSSIEINKMRLSVEWVYIFPVQPFNINLPRGQQRSFCLSQFSPLSGDPTCLAFMLIFLFQCSWSVTWNKHADKEILFFPPHIPDLHAWSRSVAQKVLKQGQLTAKHLSFPEEGQRTRLFYPYTYCLWVWDCESCLVFAMIAKWWIKLSFSLGAVLDVCAVKGLFPSSCYQFNDRSQRYLRPASTSM